MHDFQTVKQQTIAALPGVISSPDYRLGRDILKKLNPPNDPSLREATPNSVHAITHEDVIETYRKVFRPDRTTIIVIGNISSKHALNLVKSAFGNWKNPDSQMTLDYPPRPENKPSEIYVADPGRTQSDVTLVETIDQESTTQTVMLLNLGIRCWVEASMRDSCRIARGDRPRLFRRKQFSAGRIIGVHFRYPMARTPVKPTKRVNWPRKSSTNSALRRFRQKHCRR